jgi:hypothetical protein
VRAHLSFTQLCTDDVFIRLINDTRYPEEVASQCLSIILNLSCQSNKEGNVSRSEDSDDYNVVLNGMGESVLFNMLEEQIMKGIHFISRDVGLVDVLDVFLACVLIDCIGAGVTNSGQCRNRRRTC